jgi:hypothetical protein
LVSELSPPVVVYAEGTALADGFDGYTSQEELEAIWTATDPDNDRRIRLTSGSASSCHNYVISDYDPGPTVSRLYFNLGSVDGSDAEPLLVTYRFKHDVNNTNSRARFELTSSLTRTRGAVGFAFTNGVGGDYGYQYTTFMEMDPNELTGYVADYFAYDYALTGIEREPGVWHEMQIEVKTDVVNFYIDGAPANPVDAGGTPLYPLGVPRVSTGSYRYVVIGLGYSNNGPEMMYDDVAVTLGADSPFGDPNPIESPSVVGPLFPAGTLVTVTDVDPNAATAVAVFADGDEVGTANGPFPTGEAVVTVTPLSNGQAVTATQTVDSIESCWSRPVIVAVPAPALAPPLVPGQTQVAVSDIEENVASEVAVYNDLGEGEYELLGTLADPATDPATVTTIPLVFGDTIVATQTIGGVEGPKSGGVEVTVPAPTLPGPLEPGGTVVTVTDVHPLAELVTVYVDEDTYSTDPAGQATVDITVPALEIGSALRATQTISGIESPYSNTLVVGNNVVINEFNYDDPGEDNLAFVELYNAGEEAVDIGGWQIQVGDYFEGSDPNWPGVYEWIYIPAGTTIAAHGYWTVGMSDVAALPDAVVDRVDDSLRLDNGHNYVALRNANGVLLDAIAWETNKETGTPTGPLLPLEIYTQIGVGIWGNHVNADDPLTAQSRYLDGLDTDENGRDVGIQPATPGYSNNQPDLMPYFEDADGLNPFDRVPNWVFSYKPLVAVDPTVVDTAGVGGVPINPSSIPVSPDGDLAMIGWDEVGGGNVDYMGQLAKEDFTLETYVYIPPAYTPDGYEETKIGLRGSADGVHNFDWYNGATGVCWFLQHGATWQMLYLLDENNGNDGAQGEPICATVLGTIAIGTSPELTGWQRLLLEVKGNRVRGIFGGTYGSRTDGIEIVGVHDSPGPGGVYVSYREAVSDNTTARPPTFDAISLTEPSQLIGDVDGDGDVDLGDLTALLSAYGSQTGDPNYHPFADIDGDGDVDLTDLTMLLSHYGEGG